MRYGGFRVYPFGEPNDDWLDIGRDRARRLGKSEHSSLVTFAKSLEGVDPKRAILSLLSNQNHIGDVQIDPHSSAFEMKASREGFVGDRGIRELKEVVRFGIDWATIHRDYHIRKVKKKKAESARKALETEARTAIRPEQVVESAINYIQKEATQVTAKLPARERQKIQKGFVTATDAILKHEESNREELRHLRLVASTSTLLLIFSHEVKTFMGDLEQHSIELADVESKIPAPQAKKVGSIRQHMQDTKVRFRELLDMTSLIAVDSGKTQAVKLTLADRLQRAEKCFGLITTSYGISINTGQVPGNIQIGPLHEAELYAIFLNVLSNSIKSVIAAGKTKEVEITAERIGKEAVVNIRDTGLGVRADIREEVFTPFVADPNNRLYAALDSRLNPEDRFIIGTGSGLGLGIVKEIVGARNGSIKFLEPKGKWKADLEIRIP
ncbi:MAG: HAMP domain-containing histidine kinase [Phycisphaerales bacterium]|nr:HAMP domain-containing histidine kinase [Phycisphaerales bacterium]